MNMGSRHTWNPKDKMIKNQNNLCCRAIHERRFRQPTLEGIPKLRDKAKQLHPKSSVEEMSIKANI